MRDPAGQTERMLATSTGLHCPRCGAVNWRRDGYTVIASESTGEIIRFRSASASPEVDDLPWSCDGCGLDLPTDSPIANDLDEIQAPQVE